MEFLKEVLGDVLYAQVAEKLTGNEKIKLANLATGEHVSKGKFMQAETKVNELTSQLAERDKQLEALSKTTGSNEVLAKQLKDLQDSNQNVQKDYEAKLKKQERDFAMRETLKNDYKARDIVSVIPHLKEETILFADGKFTGLDEQMKALQKDKAFLFEGAGDNVAQGAGGVPGCATTEPANEFNFSFANVNGSKQK